MLDGPDAVLLEVITRELEALAGKDAQSHGPLQMIAQLLRTVETGVAEVAPAPDRDIHAEVLKPYLIDRGIAGRDASISILRSALGFSKDTYLLTITEPNVESTTLAIRRNQPAGTTRTSVLDEYPLLTGLHSLGFPVAEPLLVEPDPRYLGNVFMVSRAMPGEPNFPNIEQDPTKRENAAQELATFLARLHTLPVDSVTVRRNAPGGSSNEELAAYVAEWRGYWEEGAPDQYADMLDAYDEMESNLPDLEQLAVVHSDVGFHNILAQDGHLTAVLDWEFTHLGEPEEDLSYCRTSVEELVPWSRFIEMYQRAGGPDPAPERLKAYEVWRSLRNATCCALGRVAFEKGLNTDLRLAYAGRIILEMSVAGVREQRTAQ